jgi:hypothetical protein
LLHVLIQVPRALIDMTAGWVRSARIRGLRPAFSWRQE